MKTNFELPQYCYYVPDNNVKGDGFTCGRLHPKTNGKDWTTTRSKKVSTDEKHKQLLAYLNNTVYIPVQDIELSKKRKSPEKQVILDLSNEIYIYIFKLKNEKDITTQDASEALSKKFSKILKRDVISKIWKCEIDVPNNLKETQEYKDMVLNLKQRTKKRKFTEEEIHFLMETQKEHSLSITAKLFEDKYNKSVTKAYISGLKKF